MSIRFTYEHRARNYSSGVDVLRRSVFLESENGFLSPDQLSGGQWWHNALKVAITAAWGGSQALRGQGGRVLALLLCGCSPWRSLPLIVELRATLRTPHNVTAFELALASSQGDTLEVGAAGACGNVLASMEQCSRDRSFMWFF